MNTTWSSIVKRGKDFVGGQVTFRFGQGPAVAGRITGIRSAFGRGVYISLEDQYGEERTVAYDDRMARVSLVRQGRIRIDYRERGTADYLTLLPFWHPRVQTNH